ncbi:hypothetical protein FB451DRAFT_1187985 [Mycena latifolia]|nr:hypothetical protein FB451DRAFT_1187985 [Mycena latifolia]
MLETGSWGEAASVRQVQRQETTSAPVQFLLHLGLPSFLCSCTASLDNGCSANSAPVTSLTTGTLESILALVLLLAVRFLIEFISIYVGSFLPQALTFTASVLAVPGVGANF